MKLVGICTKIFFARILDVTIGTFRQNVMLKGKMFLTSILAFLEVFIWFLVAREALTINIESILIPICYSAGYATGTLIGTYISKRLIKGEVCLQVVIESDSKKLLDILKEKGYGTSIVNLETENKKEKKKMLFIEVNNKSLKKVENIINRYNPKAFIMISETKKSTGGTIK